MSTRPRSLVFPSLTTANSMASSRGYEFTNHCGLGLFSSLLLREPSRNRFLLWLGLAVWSQSSVHPGEDVKKRGVENKLGEFFLPHPGVLGETRNLSNEI